MYVPDVSSVSYVFIRTLHSSVFMLHMFLLFGESKGVESNGGTEQARGNEAQRAGASRWGRHDAPVSYGRGALGAGGRGLTGTECTCGAGRTASNRGG